MEKGRLLEPRSPSGQNARLRGGIEKETEGVTLVSARHSAPQFPLHPYTLRHELRILQEKGRLLEPKPPSGQKIGRAHV